MTVNRVAAGGSGYTVDAQVLHALAKIADQIAQNTDTLVAKAAEALAVGAQGGLQIGAAIERAGSGWSAQLGKLAGEADGIGSRLNGNATSYAQAESSVLESIMLRRNGPGLSR